MLTYFHKINIAACAMRRHELAVRDIDLQRSSRELDTATAWYYHRGLLDAIVGR